MTEQEVREKFDSSFAETKPIIEKMTNLIMDAYEKGFNIGFEIGSSCKIK